MSKTCSSLGFDFPVEGLPKTVDEFNTLAGRDCVLDYALQYHLAHVHLTKVRAAICEAVEKETGIARSKEEKDGKTKFTETEGQYVSRVDAELVKQGESLEEAHGAAIIAAASAVPIDLTKAIRTGSSSKVPQKWLDKVQAIRDAGKLEAFCEAHDLAIDEDATDEEIDLIVGDKVRQVTLAMYKQAEAQVIGL